VCDIRYSFTALWWIAQYWGHLCCYGCVLRKVRFS